MWGRCKLRQKRKENSLKLRLRSCNHPRTIGWTEDERRTLNLQESQGNEVEIKNTIVDCLGDKQWLFLTDVDLV